MAQNDLVKTIINTAKHGDTEKPPGFTIFIEDFPGNNKEHTYLEQFHKCDIWEPVFSVPSRLKIDKKMNIRFFSRAMNNNIVGIAYRVKEYMNSKKEITLICTCPTNHRILVAKWLCANFTESFVLGKLN